MATIKLTGLNTSTGLNATAGDNDTVDLAGSLTIGNADTDAVVFNAEIDSDFIPDDDATYDLGSSTKRWSELYIATAFLSTIQSSSDIAFNANGASEKMIIKSDGKVGIGTTPSHLLDVNGDVRVRGNDIRDNSGNPAINFDGSANVSIVNQLSFEDTLFTELSISGVQLQTDTNAYRFNCPYALEITGLALNLDTHGTSGNVTVTVANGGTTMITLSITGTNTSANTTTVTSGTRSQGDVVTFAITATPTTNTDGLRAMLFFRRTLS